VTDAREELSPLAPLAGRGDGGEGRPLAGLPGVNATRLTLGMHLLLVFTTISSSPIFAQQKSASLQAPVAGRPANFSGGIGTFRVVASATPTDIQAEGRIDFTVRVTGRGNLEHVKRPDLRKMQPFTKRFQITNGDERYLAKERTREFKYVLRPLRPDVTEIPPLPFVYYRPGATPEHLGYQTTYTSSIPLTVRPLSDSREKLADSMSNFDEAPVDVCTIATGGHVLRDHPPLAFLSVAAIAAALLLPPAFCVVVCVRARQRYPQVRRWTKQRADRALQRALNRIRHIEREHANDASLRICQIVREYLSDRLEISTEDLDRERLGARLEEAGLSQDVVEKALDLFVACDAARFGPDGSNGDLSLVKRAENLLHDVGAASRL